MSRFDEYYDADEDFAFTLASIQDYESMIQCALNVGAKDREAAISWVLDGFGGREKIQDGDEACWLLNLPFYPCPASPSGFAHEFDFYFMKGN